MRWPFAVLCCALVGCSTVRPAPPAIDPAQVQRAIDAQRRGDTATAIREYEDLARQRDPVAMVSLGLMYHHGEGVTQDYGKALDWYLEAFELGDGDAYNNLGVMFRDGLGVAKNRKMAYCLFLLTHVRSLGTESTQLRANRNLGRIVPEMTKPELVECFNYTEEYIRAYVRSRGALQGVPADLRPSRGRPALKDEDLWLPGELDFLK